MDVSASFDVNNCAIIMAHVYRTSTAVIYPAVHQRTTKLVDAHVVTSLILQAKADFTSVNRLVCCFFLQCTNQMEAKRPTLLSRVM